MPKKRKKNLVPNFVHTEPRQEILKNIAKKFKKLKNLFLALFLTKRHEIGREKEKKILVSNLVHTRPRQENSEKNSKKFKKIK